MYRPFFRREGSQRIIVGPPLMRRAVYRGVSMNRKTEASESLLEVFDRAALRESICDWRSAIIASLLVSCYRRVDPSNLRDGDTCRQPNGGDFPSHIKLFKWVWRQKFPTSPWEIEIWTCWFFGQHIFHRILVPFLGFHFVIIISDYRSMAHL